MTHVTTCCTKLAAAVASKARGQTMVEYSLIVSAIAILVFAAYTTTGRAVENLVSWGTIANDLIGS